MTALRDVQIAVLQSSTLAAGMLLVTVEAALALSGLGGYSRELSVFGMGIAAASGIPR